MATLTEDRIDQTLVEFIYGSLLPNGNFFWLIATVPQGEYSTYQNTFQNIVRSVQFHESREQPPQSITVEYKGIIYTLNDCMVTAGNLTCHLVITSNGVDRPISEGNGSFFGKYSRMFDNLGNEYRIKEMTFANNEGAATLVADVPTRSTASFENIDRGATAVSLLELLYTDEGPGAIHGWPIQFRNIPIRR